MEKEAIAFVKEALKTLPKEHRDHEYFVKFLKNMPVAEGFCDSPEKLAILDDTAIKVANQLAFILFREGLLSADLEKKYRALPSPDEASEALKKLQEERAKKTDEVRKLMTETQNEQKGIDIFVQVMAGRSKEEAEKSYEDYVAAGGR